MKKGKIISFPNKIIKHLKDKTYNEENETITRKNRGPEVKLFENNTDDEAIFLSVKYLSDTRYKQYYFLTRLKDKFVSYDLSKLIKLPRENYMSDILWIYPYKDSSVTRFDKLHFKKFLSKYRFLHVNDKNLFLNAKTHEERMKYIKDGSDFRMVHRIELADGSFINFSDHPNEYGLVCGENFLEHMVLKRYEFYPGNKVDSVFVAQDVNGNKLNLVRSRLDDGMPYINSETNSFIQNQQYLFREVSSDELPS